MTCSCLVRTNNLLAAEGLRVCEVFVPGRDAPVPRFAIEHTNGAPCVLAVLIPSFCPWCGEPYTSGPLAGPGGRQMTSTNVH